MTLHVDKREPQSIIELLRRRIENIEVHKLDVGDYAIGKEIGIERKTLHDLLNSLNYGVVGRKPRLWEQVKNLCNYYKKPVLLIEGVMWKPIYQSELTTFVRLMGVVTNFIYRWDKLKLMFTPSEKETVYFLERTYLLHTSGESRREPPPVVAKSIDPEIVKLNMLCCFRGIGVSTARKILNYYPEFRMIIEEDVKELAKKVGVKTAKLLKSVFH